MCLNAVFLGINPFEDVRVRSISQADRYGIPVDLAVVFRHGFREVIPVGEFSFSPLPDDVDDDNNDSCHSLSDAEEPGLFRMSGPRSRGCTSSINSGYVEGLGRSFPRPPTTPESDRRKAAMSALGRGRTRAMVEKHIREKALRRGQKRKRRLGPNGVRIIRTHNCCEITTPVGDKNALLDTGAKCVPPNCGDVPPVVSTEWKRQAKRKGDSELFVIFHDEKEHRGSSAVGEDTGQALIAKGHKPIPCPGKHVLACAADKHIDYDPHVFKFSVSLNGKRTQIITFYWFRKWSGVRGTDIVIGVTDMEDLGFRWSTKDEKAKFGWNFTFDTLGTGVSSVIRVPFRPIDALRFRRARGAANAALDDNFDVDVPQFNFVDIPEDEKKFETYLPLGEHGPRIVKRPYYVVSPVPIGTLVQLSLSAKVALAHELTLPDGRTPWVCCVPKDQKLRFLLQTAQFKKGKKLDPNFKIRLHVIHHSKSNAAWSAFLGLRSLTPINTAKEEDLKLRKNHHEDVRRKEDVRSELLDQLLDILGTQASGDLPVAAFNAVARWKESAAKKNSEKDVHWLKQKENEWLDGWRNPLDDASKANAIEHQLTETMDFAKMALSRPGYEGVEKETAKAFNKFYAEFFKNDWHEDTTRLRAMFGAVMTDQLIAWNKLRYKHIPLANLGVYDVKRTCILVEQRILQSILRRYLAAEDGIIFQASPVRPQDRKGKIGRISANYVHANTFLRDLALPPGSLRGTFAAILLTNVLLLTEIDLAQAFESLTVDPSLRKYIALIDPQSILVTLRASLGLKLTPAFFGQQTFGLYSKIRVPKTASDNFYNKFVELLERLKARCELD